MPDSNGKLTSEDHSKIHEWFTTKTGGKLSRCPMCGAAEWAVIDLMGELRVATRDFIIGPDSQNLPLISLICKQCGHMAFFNAAYLGIVGPAPQEVGSE